MDWIFWLKLLHTFIVFVVYGSLLYIIYCGISNKSNLILWLSFGIVVSISIAYVLNGECLITTWVRQLSGKSGLSDIFLPDGIAIKIVPVSIILMSLATLLHSLNCYKQYKFNKSSKKDALKRASS